MRTERGYDWSPSIFYKANSGEGKKLIKLKDNVGTMTSRYKLTMNTFKHE